MTDHTAEHLQSVSQAAQRPRVGVPCEIITAEQLAERCQVTERWVMDQTRASIDPLPHFKRGRVKLFQWWADCPDSPLRKWWDRHTVTQ